jgi:hypothetical protein
MKEKEFNISRRRDVTFQQVGVGWTGVKADRGWTDVGYRGGHSGVEGRPWGVSSLSTKVIKTGVFR